MIYLFALETLPIFLLTVFAKNEKDNLSAKELAALIALADRVIATYG